MPRKKNKTKLVFLILLPPESTETLLKVTQNLFIFRYYSLFEKCSIFRDFSLDLQPFKVFLKSFWL